MSFIFFKVIADFDMQNNDCIYWYTVLDRTREKVSNDEIIKIEDFINENDEVFVIFETKFCFIKNF